MDPISVHVIFKLLMGSTTGGRTDVTDLGVPKESSWVIVRFICPLFHRPYFFQGSFFRESVIKNLRKMYSVRYTIPEYNP